MNTHNLDELDQEILRKFETLQIVPPRDARAARQGRVAYLDLARRLSQGKIPAQAVSSAPLWRLKKWTDTIVNPFQRKERSSMLTALTTVALVVALLFGGAGVTTYAAQDSLPTGPLYPLKVLSEDLRLDLASNEAFQFQLALEYANRRVEEISAMQAMGEPLGEPVMTRLQEQLTYALKLAAGMPDGEMQASLLQLQAQVQAHIRTMTALQNKLGEQADPALARLRKMLQTQYQWAVFGLEDPAMFRHQIQSGATEPPAESPVKAGPGAGTGPGPEGEPPGPSYGPGPQEEPSGPSYGPGPGPQEEPPGPGEAEGPGPQEEPPGSSYGPGPGTDEDPSGSSYGPGPQGDPPGPGLNGEPDSQQGPSGPQDGSSPGSEAPHSDPLGTQVNGSAQGSGQGGQ